MKSHARKHKRQYRELTGEQPDTYADVRAALAGQVNAFGDLIDPPAPDLPGEQVEIDAYTADAFRPASTVEPAGEER